MTEQEARDWVTARVPRETERKLEQFVDIVLAEMSSQNLIAASTADHVWARHIVDSAQLASMAPESASSWIDLGAGAGFPGIVIAVMMPQLRVTLVESRRKRIDFLEFVADSLDIGERVVVAGQRLEMIAPTPHDVISARAFAPLDRLLPIAFPFSHGATRWLLPKGRSAASELEAVSTSWQGGFQVVPSLTDGEAAIIVAEQVRPKSKRMISEKERR